MRVRMHMRDCLADLDIFGCILQGESWFGWRVLLIAAAGEELTDEERAEFKRLTGRDREPGRFCRELIVAAGHADPGELDLYQRTAGNLRRLLEAVGLQRRAKPVPDLDTFLEMRKRAKRIVPGSPGGAS